MQLECLTIWVMGKALTPMSCEKWAISGPNTLISHEQLNISDWNSMRIVTVIGLILDHNSCVIA